jgi:hypothetical protein
MPDVNKITSLLADGYYQSGKYLKSIEFNRKALTNLTSSLIEKDSYFIGIACGYKKLKQFDNVRSVLKEWSEVIKFTQE